MPGHDAPPQTLVQPPEPPAAVPDPGEPAARDRRHALPLPLCWQLFGELRRRMPPPHPEILFSIFEEAMFRTVAQDHFDRSGDEAPVAWVGTTRTDARGRVRTRMRAIPPARGVAHAVERWVRTWRANRIEWIDAAHEAVGDAGMTPLRVEAFAVLRGAARSRHVSAAVRSDLEAALADASPVLSAFPLALRAGRALDLRRIRILSTRFDVCVATALLAETEPICEGAGLATPYLCAEARIAASRLRRLVEGGPARRRAAVSRGTARGEAPPGAHDGSEARG